MRYLLMKLFKNISMKKSLIISYIIVVLIPVALLGIILTVGMRRIVLRQSINEAIDNVNKIERNLTEIFKICIDVSNRVYIDDELENVVLRRYKSPWEVGLAYRNYSRFNDYINYYDELKSVRFYNTNEYLLDNWQFIKVNETIRSYTWYKEAIERNGLISWDYIQNESKNEYYFSLTRLIKNVYGIHLGVLVLDVNKDYLSSFLKDERFKVLVLNDQGYVIAAKDSTVIGRTIKHQALKEIVQKETDNIIDINYEGNKTKAVVKTFFIPKSENYYKIVSLLPTDEIVSEANKVSFLGFTIILGSLLLALIFILFFSEIILVRIKRLSMEMHSIALGDLETSISIDGKDEIGQLSYDLSTMVKSIKELIHEVYEVNMEKSKMEIKEREIKFRMLASQINPHFLFNALEAIRMKSHSKGEFEIADKVKSLAKLLRTSLEANNELIKLEKEIELVKSYLEIQSFRFGDRIKYEFHIKDIDLDYKILPFTIQPLIENAVIHGIEDKEDNGMVQLSIRKENQNLIIVILDNGVGIEKDRLRYIQDMLGGQENSYQGIGLINVHQRIQMHYGKEYGLKIESKVGFGTRIEIILPEEEAKYV